MTDDRHETIKAIGDINPDAVTLDGLDDAILGIIEGYNELPVLMYSAPKIIEILRQRDEMTHEDAIEYFEYNILGLYAGEYTPMIIDSCFITMQTSDQLSSKALNNGAKH